MAYPPELRERAKELRKQKLLIRVIAADLGVSTPTVTRWLNPKLEGRGRTRARKAKFLHKRRCPLCGKRMSDSASRCMSCSKANRRYWTRERVIDALRVWAADNGRAPTREDWELSGKGHPAVSSLLDGPNPPFASWSEALLAAGFEPRKRRGPRWTKEKLSRKERSVIRRQMREDKLKRALAKENKDEDPLEESA